jgi:hypothetical protein
MEIHGKNLYFETAKILKSNGLSEQEISPETCYVLSTMLHMHIFRSKISLEIDMTFIMTPALVLGVWQQD